MQPAPHFPKFIVLSSSYISSFLHQTLVSRLLGFFYCCFHDGLVHFELHTRKREGLGLEISPREGLRRQILNKELGSSRYFRRKQAEILQSRVLTHSTGYYEGKSQLERRLHFSVVPFSSGPCRWSQEALDISELLARWDYNKPLLFRFWPSDLFFCRCLKGQKLQGSRVYLSAFFFSFFFLVAWFPSSAFIFFFQCF